MTLLEAIKIVSERFPFPGYLERKGAQEGAFVNIPETVLRYLRPGDRILDFGCGSCDKTAVLQVLGFKCSGYDDLSDHWHMLDGNREKILDFARGIGIDFHLATGSEFPFAPASFDMVMLHDVIEHLHDSPRGLLNDLLALVKPEGLLFITVPNAVNIRKRIDVMRGRTNLPPFDNYYWYPGPWRGHVREYVRKDLEMLAEFLDLEVLEIRGCDHMLRKVPTSMRSTYLLLTKFFNGWKDSWSFVGRKPTNWSQRKSLPNNDLRRILAASTSYNYSAE